MIWKIKKCRVCGADEHVYTITQSIHTTRTGPLPAATTAVAADLDGPKVRYCFGLFTSTTIPRSRLGLFKTKDLHIAMTRMFILFVSYPTAGKVKERNIADFTFLTGSDLTQGTHTKLYIPVERARPSIKPE